jgi:hypothetical protein
MESFKDNKILKPHLTDRIGIRMTFPEGAECILWTNGKKYYAVCEAFGTIFTVNIPRNLGDDLFLGFKTEFEGNFSYQPFLGMINIIPKFSCQDNLKSLHTIYRVI